MENETPSTIEFVGREAAILSAVEVGLGSVLHGLHVPFAGHFLSLNQGFLLSRATLKARAARANFRLVPLHISQIAAILKSLSPAGKKLTPMLAISAQGLLFTLGVSVFGANFAGIAAGMLLLSCWAFLQPLLIYYVLFGRSLLVVGEHYYRDLQKALTFTDDQFFTVLGLLVLLKLVLALFTALLVYRLPEAKVARFQESLLRVAKVKPAYAGHQTKHWREHLVLACKDLFRPLFVVWLGLTALFFIFADSPLSTVIWALLRPLAVGLLIFFLIRIAPVDQWLRRWEHGRLAGFSRAFRVAVSTLKEI